MGAYHHGANITPQRNERFKNRKIFGEKLLLRASYIRPLKVKNALIERR